MDTTKVVTGANEFEAQAEAFHVLSELDLVVIGGGCGEVVAY